MIWHLLFLFVIINLIQAWFILSCGLLLKGGIAVGLIEAVELPLTIYLILKGEPVVFLVIVAVETIQWLGIAYFTLRDKKVDST
jgi:hypothetical protein